MKHSTSGRLLLFALATSSGLLTPDRASAQTTDVDTAAVRATSPVVGGPCEGCEAVFEGLPAKLSSTARIAPVSEPGEPLRITGTVYGPEGEPAPGVVVYAYHTNVEGVYPPGTGLGGSAERHGRLRAWVITDAGGRYRFDTIRPAGYPGRDTPQHVHMHVIEPGCCTYWLTSVHFADDPRLDPGAQPEGRPRGGDGIVEPRRTD
ncbi:MAG TPA: intradiol ring-cleavage dioxygenase, partial [Alphaproteobacteria bacterium]|nr:intradiol ring-cleavage dioxygenase [Alphaproteobacteria bacterium]